MISFVSMLCHTKHICIDSFKIDIRNLLEKVDHCRIINIDETAIFLAPKNLKIWHYKGKVDVSVPFGFNVKNRVQFFVQ